MRSIAATRRHTPLPAANGITGGLPNLSRWASQRSDGVDADSCGNYRGLQIQSGTLTGIKDALHCVHRMYRFQSSRRRILSSTVHFFRIFA